MDRPRFGTSGGPEAGAGFGAGRRAALGALAGTVTLLAASPGVFAASLTASVQAALREGGCVLLLRHAVTEPGVGDPPGFRLDDCATQRNLSADGRAQAEQLGAALKAARVPIGPVRSSRWCRCLDTARLAFGRVEPWPALDSFFADRSAAADAQTAEARRWALAFRGPANAVLVTHQVNITALTGLWPDSGETLVVRPEAGAMVTVGRFGGRT